MIPHDFIENDDVLRFFVADLALVSASVVALHIFDTSGSLTVDLDVILLYSKKEKKYRIRFEEVLEYAFYCRNERYFYYITNLKFFKEGDGYYIALDPDESTNSRSTDDNDFVLCNKIKAFVLTDENLP